MVLLKVQDESELKDFVESIPDGAIFVEPDIGNEATAYTFMGPPSGDMADAVGSLKLL